MWVVIARSVRLVLESIRVFPAAHHRSRLLAGAGKHRSGPDRLEVLGCMVLAAAGKEVGVEGWVEDFEIQTCCPLILRTEVLEVHSRR